MFCSCLNLLNCTFEVSLLIMFGIFSRCSGKRNFHAARMEEVSMRSFASAIDKPMLFQIRDELPNLTRHKIISSKGETSKQCQSNSRRKPKLRNRKAEVPPLRTAPGRRAGVSDLYSAI